MRYAIISDLHSNRQAFEAVVDDIDRSQIDMVLCLGDIVGYGPSPIEVMDMAYEYIDVSILGNHDAVVCNKFSSAYFNSEAKEIIEWTRSILRERDIEYFRKQAYVIDGEHLKCSHANFYHPDNFGYILSIDDAAQSFREVKERLLFVGHTHIPGAHIHSRNGNISWVDGQKLKTLKLDKNKRYIVNVGSVGVSRGSEFKSNYCIYDSDAKSIAFRTVEFDIHSFAKDVHALNKPVMKRYFSTFIEDIDINE